MKFSQCFEIVLLSNDFSSKWRKVPLEECISSVHKRVATSCHPLAWSSKCRKRTTSNRNSNNVRRWVGTRISNANIRDYMAQGPTEPNPARFPLRSINIHCTFLFQQAVLLSKLYQKASLSHTACKKLTFNHIFYINKNERIRSSFSFFFPLRDSMREKLAKIIFLFPFFS